MQPTYSSPTSVNPGGFPGAPPPPYAVNISSPTKRVIHHQHPPMGAPPPQGTLEPRPYGDHPLYEAEQEPRQYNPPQHHQPAPPPYGYAPPPPRYDAVPQVGMPLPPPPSYEQHIASQHASRNASPMGFRDSTPHGSPGRRLHTPTSADPPAYNSRFRHDPYSPDGTPRVLSPAPRQGM